MYPGVAVDRLLAVALSTVLALSACKVERTPPEFFDQRRPAADEMDAAADELRARLALLAQALGRGDTAGAATVLGLGPETYVIGPNHEAPRAGAEALHAAFARLAAPDAAQLQVRELQVSVSPRASVAWFTALLEPAGGVAQDEVVQVLRVSGVYVQHEGSWRLTQLHMSHPTPRDSVPASPVTTAPAYPLLPAAEPGRG